MAGDQDYIAGKHPDRIYVSREFSTGEQGNERAARIVSRVLESGDREGFAQIKKELVIRITPRGRQQIKAVFFLDERQIETLILQRFSMGTNKPHEEVNFSLKGDEINKLLEVVSLIKTASFDDNNKVRIDESDLEQFSVTKEAAHALAKANPNLIAEIAEHEITERDIIAVAYRKKALEKFNRFLSEPDYVAEEKDRLGVRGEEYVWQAFFEENPWIFGYGLFYVFSSELDEKKLEQIVSGASIRGAGKRTDALLRTRGLVSALCFVEIKTNRTQLLEREPYRPDAWAISRELAGAVAQAQRTVRSAEENIGGRLEPRDDKGNPTGEVAYLLRPRSVVVAGSLAEFKTKYGINEPKFSSFELFRRQVTAPEIITFDELFERAKFIVEDSEIKRSATCSLRSPI